MENLEEINWTNYNDSRLESDLIIIDQDNSNQRRESVNERTNFNGEEVIASWNRRTQVTTERLSHLSRAAEVNDHRLEHTGNFRNMGNQIHNANFEYY